MLGVDTGTPCCDRNAGLTCGCGAPCTDMGTCAVVCPPMTCIGVCAVIGPDDDMTGAPASGLPCSTTTRGYTIDSVNMHQMDEASAPCMGFWFMFDCIGLLFMGPPGPIGPCIVPGIGPRAWFMPGGIPWLKMPGPADERTINKRIL